MRFTLPALSPADSLIAQNPESDLEANVFVSPVEVIQLGRILVDPSGVATWKPKPGASFGTGLDIHVRCDTPIRSTTAAPVITLATTIPGAPVVPPATPNPPVTGTAVATFGVPSWSADQAQIYPAGASFDLIPAGAGNTNALVLSITGVTSATNVQPNAEFTVYGSPAASNFVEVGFKRGVEGPYNTPGSIHIADKYNPAAAIKEGRPEVPELHMEFAHISHMDGISRYNGSRVSVLLMVKKDKAVLTSNILYVGYRPASSPARKDGNNEVVESSKGPYENVLLFGAV